MHIFCPLWGVLLPDPSSQKNLQMVSTARVTRRFISVCPPEGGLGSSWLKHALKQRSPTTPIGVVRVVVVLALERVFAVGGEVMAATTRILATAACSLQALDWFRI